MSNIKHFPLICDLHKDAIMPVASVQYNNEGEIITAEVWDGDDFIVLEKGEFAVFLPND